MRDDLEFYITLLREVECHPVLYDHNDTNYSNRTAGENAWIQIGTKLSETGIACKSKWRNLRSTYIRYLHSKAGNRSGACPQKEYYLAPYFNFLKPFIRSRKSDNHQPESSLETTDNDSTEQICVPLLKVEDSSMGYETEESRSNDGILTYSPRPLTSGLDSQQSAAIAKTDSHSQSPQPACAQNAFAQTSANKREFVDWDACAAPKRQKLESDACELFLLSLVPRMQSMTEPQQLSFQIGVMQLLQNIKYSTMKPD